MASGHKQDSRTHLTGISKQIVQYLDTLKHRFREAKSYGINLVTL